MKTKGFTLVELLGVVFILALLGLLIVPVINGILDKKKRDLYEVQVRHIEDGARAYMSEHIFEYDIDSTLSVGFELPYLQRLGYIKEGIKNPITGKDFSNMVVVVYGSSDDSELKVMFGSIEKDWNGSNINSNYYHICTVCSEDNECVMAEVLWRYD